MLLAADVILVGVLAIVCPLTSRAILLEGRFGCSGSSGRLGIYDLFGEDLGGYRWEGSNSSLQIVTTKILSEPLFCQKFRMNVLPVATHMPTLQLTASERHLAGVARIRVRLSSV